MRNTTFGVRESCVMMMGTLRDFGPSLDIWSECFLINHCMIMLEFFGVAIPILFSVLQFHAQIGKLRKIYEWQNAILPLAIDYHTKITLSHHTDVGGWILPQDWADLYSSPFHLLNVPSSKKRAATTTVMGHE